jgi:hypothetical protein
MLKPGKRERIKQITIPMALLLSRSPAIPLVSKVRISFGISGSVLIVLCSGHARLASGPSSVFPVSDAHCSASASISTFKACRARLYRQSVHEVLIAIYEAVAERVFGWTYALEAYPEYRAFFLAPPSYRPGLLPSMPLLTSEPPLSSSSLPSPSPSPSLSRLRVTGQVRPPAMVLVALRVTFCW